jgi:ketose-bisphosphate aldolase
MNGLLAEAQCGHYAVCYCEAWSLESFQAVVEAAEELQSPVITGFNGGFLMHPGRAKPENLAYCAALRAALCSATVPVAFLLNETDSFEQIEDGVRLGFNSVMVENEHLGWDEYRQLVKQVVKVAHSQDVAVEAQIGRLANSADHSAAEPADPATARAFVEETEIDALAVAVGNVHILTTGTAPIDLGALERIHDQVKVPLVLHGGTGIPLEVARSCIQLGVAKVNFGTGLKQAYLAAVREKLAAYREPMSPHPFLGMGGREDILVAGREAVKLKVKQLLHGFSSAGKAEMVATLASASGRAASDRIRFMSRK